MSNELMVSESSNFSPANLAELESFGKKMADSSFVPENMRGKPGDIIAAIMMGNEIGLAPMQALQNIAVINGKPSVWGDAALGLVKSHHDFEWIKESIERRENVGLTAICIIKRKGEDPYEQHFSMAEAKQAKLAGKPGPWQTYPRRMLQMRARSWAIRDVFPDALKGLYIREEALDMPMESTQTIETDPVKSKAKRIMDKLGVNDMIGEGPLDIEIVEDGDED